MTNTAESTGHGGQKSEEQPPSPFASSTSKQAIASSAACSSQQKQVICSQTISRPNDSDVVFGRGKGFQRHPGNERMRKIVNEYKAKYYTLERLEKKRLVADVYNEVVYKGARFLARSRHDEYFEVDRTAAMAKVCTALRCKKIFKKANDAISDSKPAATLNGSFPPALSGGSHVSRCYSSKSKIESVASKPNETAAIENQKSGETQSIRPLMDMIPTQGLSQLPACSVVGLGANTLNELLLMQSLTFQSRTFPWVEGRRAPMPLLFPTTALNLPTISDNGPAIPWERRHSLLDQRVYPTMDRGDAASSSQTNRPAEPSSDSNPNLPRHDDTVD